MYILRHIFIHCIYILCVYVFSLIDLHLYRFKIIFIDICASMFLFLYTFLFITIFIVIFISIFVFISSLICICVSECIYILINMFMRIICIDICIYGSTKCRCKHCEHGIVLDHFFNPSNGPGNGSHRPLGCVFTVRNPPLKSMK